MPRSQGAQYHLSKTPALFYRNNHPIRILLAFQKPRERKPRLALQR